MAIQLESATMCRNLGRHRLSRIQFAPNLRAVTPSARTRVLSVSVICSLLVCLCGEASDETGYRMPPQMLVDLVDAPLTPSVEVDPTNTWLLILERLILTSIEELSQPELRIGGVRINPRTNTLSRRSYFTDLALKRIVGGEELSITGLPNRARIRNVAWSPNGEYIAFTNVAGNEQSLWVVDLSSGRASKLLSERLNSTTGSPFHWLSDNQTLVCKIVGKDRGEPPAEPSVSAGPIIQETEGKKAPARTYQDLLKNPYDEALFEYYLRSQLLTVTLEGKKTELSSPALIKRAEPSPDGNYLLVETLHRPFSYFVPLRRFPYRVEIWDLKGDVVKSVADLPLAEEVPIGIGAVPTGPREFDWRDDVPATLYWTEAQDGGDPKAMAEVRDQVYTLTAPFSGQPKPLVSLGFRYYRIRWGNGNLALVSEWWWKNRNLRTWIIRPDADEADKTLLFDYSWQDRYNDPGQPLLKKTPSGGSVLITSNKGRNLYLSGDGASSEGDRPFFDELDLTTQNAKRLWRSQAPYYERAIQLIDPEDLTLLIRRETKKEPPNFFLLELESDELTQITEFPHPTAQLVGIQKELIRYERPDGVMLTGTLYLPPNFMPEDGPLPMVMWAYPTEYKSADAAGQVTDSPYRFVRVGWWTSVVWVAMGYALLDNPSMPIIGEGEEEPNDSYVEQLVASAQAAVDEVVRRGVAEPGRIAIAGRSYGAFMTANLLAHSDLFSAGMAYSGAYNRTLTPFGFQAEERTFWEAPEVYFEMSPFMHADKVNEPILLVHGEADNNSGTFPLQSRRFYHALKGHGATARLVMLPHESHGYRARESILHALWETNAWVEKYVKNGTETKQRDD